MRTTILRMSIASFVALGCAALAADEPRHSGGAGAGAGAGARENVRGGGAGAAGARGGANVGGNVQARPAPANPGVNVQGPRGGNFQVQPRVNPGVSADVRGNVGPRGFVGGGDVDRGRYRWDGGRWWYWLPSNRWMYYNDGNWVDYSSDYGGADSNYRWYNGYWWYWTANGWLVWMNGQWVVPGSGYTYSDYGNTYYGGSPYYNSYRYPYYGYDGRFPYGYWTGARAGVGNVQVGTRLESGAIVRGGAGGGVSVASRPGGGRR
jgi:hypothetical protein